MIGNCMKLQLPQISNKSGSTPQSQFMRQHTFRFTDFI